MMMIAGGPRRAAGTLPTAMSDFYKIIDRYLAAGSGEARPPDWLVAPHLRKRSPVRPAPIIAPGSNDNHPPTPPSRRRRTIPFPDWRDDRGAPLAALLGPPRWREFNRS